MHGLYIYTDDILSHECYGNVFITIMIRILL